MKNLKPCALAIRIVLACTGFALPMAAAAAELSPWLGSDGQAPFQLDPVTKVAVTYAADPLYTGTLSKPACLAKGCEVGPNAATTMSTTGSAPKN